jgi:hypothetical protein
MRACVGFPDLRRELFFLLELPEDAVVLNGAASEGVKRQPPKKGGSGEDVGLDVPVCAVFEAGSTSILSSLALRLRERSSLSLTVDTGLFSPSLDGGVGWEIGNV